MRNLLGKVNRRLSKLNKKNFSIIARKFQALPTLSWLDRQPYSKEGRAKILGLDFEYTDGETLSVMFREQFFDKINDFWCNKSNPIILDCGANIGVSVLRYKYLYPQSKIVAFEPDPIICKKLIRNLEINHANNVEVVEAAVWTKNGTITFSMDHLESGRIETNKDEILKSNTSVMKARSIRLADYLNEQIDFIKLDIEGAEYNVLQDCKDKLHNVDKIIVEAHYTVDRPDLLGELWMILHQAGMKVMSSVWQPKSNIVNLSQPFEKKNLSYDQWYIIYAWR